MCRFSCLPFTLARASAPVSLNKSKQVEIHRHGYHAVTVIKVKGEFDLAFAWSYEVVVAVFGWFA